MSDDAATVLDVATHEDPEQASARLWHVIANGVFADSFAPYAVHIYRVPKVGPAPPQSFTAMGH